MSGSGEGTSSSGNLKSEDESVPCEADVDSVSPKKKREESGGYFECNICLDAPHDPVISYCGHLFCWACLHGWMEMRPRGQQTCPVCKAAVDKTKVVPLYGRNSKQEDPREKVIPPRPQAQRTEAAPDGTHGHPGQAADFLGVPFPGFGFGNAGFHMTLGFGALPFTLLASALNLTGNQHVTNTRADRDVVSKIFLWLAVILILWIIFY